MAVAVWDVYLRSDKWHYDHTEYTEYKQSEAAQKLSVRCPSAKAVCIDDFLKSYDARNDANEDLKAQKNMAFWAAFMGISTAFMTALTAIAVFYVFRTAQFTRDTLTQAEKTNEAAWATLEETKRTNEVQNRAWVEVVNCRVKFDNDTLEIEITVENFGKSPAYRVSEIRNLHLKGIDGGEDRLFSDFEMLDGMVPAIVMLLPARKQSFTHFYKFNGPQLSNLTIWGDIFYSDGFSKDFERRAHMNVRWEICGKEFTPVFKVTHR